jgi:uridine kinase
MVGVDGVDGSGKSTFADDLAPVIERHGPPVIRASVDGFHNPRAVRYKRGRADPEGFFLDSYDYQGLQHYLLDPFRHGAARVQTARFDHKTDQKAIVEQQVAPSAVLLFDGIFLHRDELSHQWDFSIFLSVPFDVSFERMSRRDGCSPDPLASENRRYFEGQNIYLRACKPAQRATITLNNL